MKATVTSSAKSPIAPISPGITRPRDLAAAEKADARVEGDGNLDQEPGHPHLARHCRTAETDCSLAQPIIISCAGRSGSTLFYRLLAQHKDLGWLSTYNQAFPRQVWLAIASRLYGKRIFNRFRNSFFFPKPFAAYKFWKQYLPDITRHDRPLVAGDVPDAAIEPLRRRISKILRYQGKKRLLIKVTGWARMAYFDRVFPDAYFIYLKREPIAIVSSWINAGWLNVTGEIGTNAWEWGEVPERHRALYHELGGGPLLSAAIKTQLDIDDLCRNAAQFPSRCYVLRYEDFVAEPRRTLRETFKHCQLPWYPSFDDIIARTTIHDYSDRWKKYISQEDAQRVLEFFRRVTQDPQEAIRP